MGERTKDKKVNSAPEQEAGGGGEDNIDIQMEDRAADISGEGRTEGDKDGAAAEEPGPEQKIAELEALLAELNDQYLRKAADFENFRKRMNREKQDAIDFANQSLIQDLIPIIDDFERAIKAAETAIAGTSAGSGGVSKDFTTLYEGISMTEKRLLTQLENRWGLKRYDSAGELFDPNLHEALMMEKSADVSEATVQEEWSKGYTLKDRVVRTAKVKVLMPDGKADGKAAGSAAGDNAAENNATENENAASGIPANGNSGAEAAE
jgi:molecular chaperone GrpE